MSECVWVFVSVCVCTKAKRSDTSTGLIYWILDIQMENDRPVAAWQARRHSSVLSIEHMHTLYNFNSMSFNRFWNLLFYHIEYNWFPCELQWFRLRLYNVQKRSSVKTNSKRGFRRIFNFILKRSLYQIKVCACKCVSLNLKSDSIGIHAPCNRFNRII